MSYYNMFHQYSRNQTMKKLLIILIVILISGCTKGIRIQESFKSENYDFSSIQSSKIKFGGTTKIFLKEFVDTFNDEYSDTTKLNDKLYTVFSNEFGKQMPQASLARLETEIPKELLGELSFKESNLESVNLFFSNLDSDFFLFINNIEISNSYQTNQFYNANTHTTSTSSTENCQVSIEVECWDVDKQKRILRFKSLGSDSVVFFTFLKSLNNAIGEAIKNSVTFIKNGGTKKS